MWVVDPPTGWRDGFPKVTELDWPNLTMREQSKELRRLGYLDYDSVTCVGFTRYWKKEEN